MSARTRPIFALALLLATGTGARAGEATNHLAGESSPYLQLHADNPVDWYPWGPEAFAKAKAEDKPVFLSIGYSTCHWCHVMERLVFSNPLIASLMNDGFVSIKVDREERPDIDDVYMRATHLLTGSGGWPNSVFLTPDRRPFFAGTYYPPEDDRGLPGFPRVLQQIRAAWENQRDVVEDAADRLALAVARTAAPLEAEPVTLDPEKLLTRAVDDLEEHYDARWGGFTFGDRTKFPRPATLDLLLVAAERDAHPKAREMLVNTLDQMAFGGIQDQLAGGFHRYSTDPTWAVPHFEKMLADNAQLIGTYARAAKATGRPLYRRVVEDTVAWLERDLSAPGGGFHSAQDAQVGGVEGASYIWTEGEIETLLGQERAKAFLRVYELEPVRGSDGSALRVDVPIAKSLQREKANDPVELLDRFAGDRRKLLAARNRRAQPMRDDKVIASWNGLAIRSLADAGALLGHPEWIERAARAARFTLANLRAKDGRLHRSWMSGQAREQGVLDDYANLADGLLALHRASDEEVWLTEARALADRMLEDFEDPVNGGFYLTPAGTDLFVRPRPFDDQSEPAAAGVALRVLRELSARTGEERYTRAAARCSGAYTALFEQSPSVAATAVVAQLPRPGLPYAAPDAPGLRLPRSGDVVKLALRRPEGAGERQLVLELAMEDGWHVNANPASGLFLVPTSVEAEGGPKLASVEYPPGRAYEPSFRDEAISVWSGRVAIPLVLGEGKEPASLAVRYQACDATRCLPPETTGVALP